MLWVYFTVVRSKLYYVCTKHSLGFTGPSSHTGNTYIMFHMWSGWEMLVWNSVVTLHSKCSAWQKQRQQTTVRALKNKQLVSGELMLQSDVRCDKSLWGDFRAVKKYYSSHQILHLKSTEKHKKMRSLKWPSEASFSRFLHHWFWFYWGSDLCIISAVYCDLKGNDHFLGYVKGYILGGNPAGSTNDM